MQANDLVLALGLAPVPSLTGRGAGWLAQRSAAELAALGVPPMTQRALLAAVQAAREALLEAPAPVRVTKSVDAAGLVGPFLAAAVQERAVVICLDIASNVISVEEISRGSVDTCVLDSREVYAVALRARANAIIIAHNHPAGSVEPSPQDRDVTDEVARVGGVVGIPLVEHIIVGKGGRWSTSREWVNVKRRR